MAVQADDAMVGVVAALSNGIDVIVVLLVDVVILFVIVIVVAV